MTVSCLAAAFLHRRPHPRLDEPLLFEPAQRHVDGRAGHATVGPTLDLFHDGHAVHVFAELEDCEQYHLLELA